MIELTDNADIHLSSIIVDKNVPAIKLSINSGGCSGFSYDWQLIEKELDDDEKFPLDNDHSLLVDGMSLLYLAGMTIDYQKDIFGSLLKIDNPNIQSSCGCGESFTV